MTRIYARATMRGWRGGFVFPALGRRRRAGRLCMTWRRGCRSATGCEPAIVTPLGPGARGTTDDPGKSDQPVKDCRSYSVVVRDIDRCD